MDNLQIKEAVKKIDTKMLNETEMQKQDGEFAALDVGITHYQVQGEGNPVVLVHGYATPYYIYDKLFDAFVKNGYRVLRYDLLGRGFSQRINADYKPELFAKQLEQIVNYVFGDEKFLLVGTSMGGTICATYCASHRDRVKKLVLLAPAGMDTFEAPLYMKLCKMKGIGEAVFYNIAGKLLLKKCASELYRSSEKEKDYYMRKFADAAQYNGFLRCTLSSLRNTILKTKKATDYYKKVGKTDMPILCIWGDIDKTMPYYQHERLLEVCKQTKLITYKDSGHVFLFDDGERCAHDVLDFFAEDALNVQ